MMCTCRPFAVNNNNNYYYYSGDQITKNEMGEACGTYGSQQCAYWVLVWNPEGKKPFRRPRGRWKVNFIWIFKQWDGKASEQEQVEGSCKCGNEPSGSIK
jgi:hypothetical protein